MIMPVMAFRGAAATADAPMNEFMSRARRVNMIR